MQVLVTGAAGFLGRSLVHELIAHGHTVTATDHVAVLPSDADQVRWRHLDVLDANKVQATMSDHDLVFHLAAKITLHDRDTAAWRLNTQGVRNVARAALAAEVPRFVHCSSVHSFDTSAPGVLSEASTRSVAGPLPLYDRSKYAGEIALRRIVEEGLPATIANPTGVFGPPDMPGNLSRMNDMLCNAALGLVPADIAGGFDWVDVRDVATGLLQVAKAGRVGENYLLGGHPLEIHTALRMAANVAGRRGPAFKLPYWFVKGIVPLASSIGRRVGSDILTDASRAAMRWTPVVDHTKVHDELGYRVRPAEQTIRDLVAHFVQTGQLDRHSA